MAIAILRLLEEQMGGALDLTQRLEARFGHRLRLDAGEVYPLLRYLEDRGFVTEEAVGEGKMYVLTEAGFAHLAEGTKVSEGPPPRGPESHAPWAGSGPWGPRGWGPFHGGPEGPGPDFPPGEHGFPGGCHGGPGFRPGGWGQRARWGAWAEGGCGGEWGPWGDREGRERRRERKAAVREVVHELKHLKRLVFRHLWAARWQPERLGPILAVLRQATDALAAGGRREGLG